MLGWRAAPVVLVILCGLATSAHPAQRRVDSVEMKRLFFELRVESGRFVNAARMFLVRTGRWYPQGDDEVLWAGIEAFEDSVDAVAGEYSRTAYPKSMEKQTRVVMVRAMALDQILEQAEILVGLENRWSDLEEMVSRAADEYGWDYASARFEALPEPEMPAPEDEPPLYQPPPNHFDEEIDPERKTRVTQLPSRFTANDDVAVGEAINEIDHLTRSVVARLSASRVVATGKLSEVGGSGREDGWDLPQQMQRERIEADLLAFESAASEAQHQFALTQRAADIRLEVATLLKLGRRIEWELQRDQMDEDAQVAWTAVRGKLNFLAVVYDLETLRYN